MVITAVDKLVTRRRAMLLSKLVNPIMLYEELGDPKHRTVFAGRQGQVVNDSDNFVKLFIQGIRSTYPRMHKWSDDEIATEIMKKLDAEPTGPRPRLHEQYVKRLLGL